MKKFIFLFLFLFVFSKYNLYSQNAWNEVYIGWNAPKNSIVAVDNLNIFTETMKSTNGGENWTSNGYDVYPSASGVCFINASTGWKIAKDNGVIKIHGTTNQGQSWNQLFLTAYVENWEGNFSIYSKTGTNISFFYPASCYTSTNNGQNWYHINSNNSGGSIRASFVNSNTGWYVGSYTGTNNNVAYIQKTTDGGINWTQQLVELTHSYFNSVWFINENTGFVTGNASSSGSLLIKRTTNGGLNWSNISISHNRKGLDIQFINNLTGFIVGDYFFAKTINGGLNWNIYNMPHYLINRVCFINESIGFLLATNINQIPNYDCILKTTVGGVGIKQINNSIPENFMLNQNYPNPFNPITNIKYEIRKNEYVKLAVYDVLGNELETLVKEKQSAGTYEILFDASKYSSGVYLYKIKTESFEDTKKMILLK